MRLKLRRAFCGDTTRLRVVPPEPATNRKGIAVAVIVKNEAFYLRDWLTFQALSGVDEVLLYDNGSTDGTVEIARTFDRIPVTVTPWKLSAWIAKSDMVIAEQELAYAHAIANHGARFRWMAFIDSDEIIVPVVDRSLGEALKPLEGHTNVSLPWVMFGHGGHDYRPEAPFTHAFTQRAAEHSGALVNFKCIVDPCAVTLVRTHKVETRTHGTETVNDQGVAVSDYKARREPSFRSTARLQLNHYFLRSRADFRAKVEAGDITDAPKAKVAEHRLNLQRQIEAGPVEDTVTRAFLERVGCENPRNFRQFGVGKP